MPFLPSLLLVSLVSAAAPAVSTGELTSFLKVISASAGAPGRIACRDMDLSFELKKNGLSPDAKAPLAWAANEDQLRTFLAEGKLVVGGNAAMLTAGAAIAITKENGKPVILVSAKNVAAAGVTLSDALLKISKLKH
jgi:hypothetical protein